jgi:hypothetical protein
LSSLALKAAKYPVSKHDASPLQYGFTDRASDGLRDLVSWNLVNAPRLAKHIREQFPLASAQDALIL